MLLRQLARLPSHQSFRVSNGHLLLQFLPLHSATPSSFSTSPPSTTQEHPLMTRAKSLIADTSDLYVMPLSLRLADGRKVPLTSLYQDTSPSGGKTRGTVVCMHGSPGSHRYFKFITPFLVMKNIRVIGINLPGFGLSEDSPALRFNNVEFNEFTQIHLERLGIRWPVVFLGYSRACENALQLTAVNQETVAGAVLVNPTGLRPHAGVRPHAFFRVTSALYDWLPPARPLLHFLYYHLYAYLGKKVWTGRIAVVCGKSVAQLNFEGQRAVMDKVMESPGKQRVLFAYSGKDFVVEPAVSEEFTATLRDCVHLVCEGKEKGPEQKMTDEMKAAFSSGRRSVSAKFLEEVHSLQKFRAFFIAEGVDAIFESTAARGK